MGEILDSDWSRQNLLRSDWSLPRVAPLTTHDESDFILRMQISLRGVVSPT